RQHKLTGPVPVYVHGDNDTIYEVELATRAVRVAFAGEPVRAAGLMTRHAPGPDAGRSFLVVCTDDAVLKLDGPNHVVRRFPLPEDLRDRGFSWLETDSGGIVIVTYLDYDPRSSEALFRVSWFDAGDRLVRQEETRVRWPALADPRVFVAGPLSP